VARPLIASRRAEIAIGLVAFIGGSLLIRDAYDKRGFEPPWWSRPFTWW
jgi:hypothetical protein